ncbi:MAG: hypothetical protein PHP88_01590 [bacterium]|nr:hypothetical protein [bacterium]
MNTRKRAVAFAVSMAVAIALVVIGVFREEMGEVLFNASMLCLSCIGMG